MLVASSALIDARLPSFAQSAQQLSQEIDALSSQIADSRERIEDLRDEEDTLKNQLEILDAEINQSEAELRQTEEEIAGVEEQIADTEEELAFTEKLIKEHGRTLYKEGTPSTLEVLFASDNFNDFINRQEYLERAKEGLNEAAQDVVALKKELELEQESLNVLMIEQEAQRDSIQYRISEQERLLEQTRGEEERYQELVESQEEELRSLRQEQAAIIAQNQAGGNMRSGDTNYPYMHSDCFDDDGRFNGMDRNSPCSAHVDPWRFFYQQCTSYVAWRRHDMGIPIPKWWGGIVPTDARHFPERARQSNMRVDRSPAIGAIAVETQGQWGHVMIVEDVYGEYIDISQFNAELDGRYSEVTGIPKSQWSQYTFIHE